MNRRRSLRGGQWLLVLALPLVLLAGNLRLVTGHWFVRWEYRRPGFPTDPFGLSTEERIRLAAVCQDYLASNAGISLLADLQLPDGDRAFNERELSHMEDVQAVYLWLSVSGAIAALLWAGGAAVLAASGRARDVIPAALLRGSLFALGLLTAVGSFMLISWGRFFTAFHRLFFEGDTWVFPPSDTLIRLFPNRFWVDIGAALVGLLVIEAVLVGVAGRLLMRRPARRGGAGIEPTGGSSLTA